MLLVSNEIVYVKDNKGQMYLTPPPPQKKGNVNNVKGSNLIFYFPCFTLCSTNKKLLHVHLFE